MLMPATDFNDEFLGWKQQICVIAMDGTLPKRGLLIGFIM